MLLPVILLAAVSPARLPPLMDLRNLAWRRFTAVSPRPRLLVRRVSPQTRALLSSVVCSVAFFSPLGLELGAEMTHGRERVSEVVSEQN